MTCGCPPTRPWLIDTLALLMPYNGNDLGVHAVSKVVNSVTIGVNSVPASVKGNYYL